MPLGMPAPAVALQRIPPVCFPLLAFTFVPRLAFFHASVPQRGCLLSSHHLANLLFPIKCVAIRWRAVVTHALFYLLESWLPGWR